MKRLAAVCLLGVVGMVGCGKYETNYIADIGHPSSAPRNGLNELRIVAQRHRLWYKVMCLDWNSDPGEAFMAALCEGSCDLTFAEDGGGRKWFAHGATQEEASRHLVDDYLGGKAPNQFTPNHRLPPPSVSHSHKQCPEPISGGPQ